ncbi:type IV pilin N-terminal domain-containing protein [Halorientalis halophila]|uniref:type IV pilin N-terminal domain-containing protein n=1 Tax=Halorientalis halophila TaxID=3108499 RepID=UPI00300803E0
MNVKGLFTDDSAVSPVIGVVLMVAITVLLAATAATFFIGIGQDNSNSTPQVATSFDYDQEMHSSGNYRVDTLKISHDSGDTITAKNLDIVVSDAETYDTSGGGSYSDLNDRYQWDEFDGVGGSDSKVSGGDTVKLEAGQDPLASDDGLRLDGATVKIVWDDPGSSSTFTLNTWEN